MLLGQVGLSPQTHEPSLHVKPSSQSLASSQPGTQTLAAASQRSPWAQLSFRAFEQIGWHVAL
jgi:hypothetical protein